MNVLSEHSDGNHPVDPANEIFNGLPNLIGVGNSLGGHFNELWCEYTGLSSSDNNDLCWLNTLHPDDYARVNTLRQ